MYYGWSKRKDFFFEKMRKNREIYLKEIDI